MQSTQKDLKNKNENKDSAPVAVTRSSAFGKTSEAEMQTDSQSLSKNLAVSLMELIKDVNSNGVTPETVNASCNAAAQVYKILRLNFEMKKEGY